MLAQAANSQSRPQAITGAVNSRSLRVCASIAIGIVATGLCWLALNAHGPNVGKSGHVFYGGDFGWNHMAAREFLQGVDPYRHPPAEDYAPYPFPAVIFAMPFLVLPPVIAASVFFGISSGLMAYGLLANGWASLLVFTCCPFWIALQWAQWTPLIVASAFFSFLAITVCIKPQISLPVVLTHLNKVAIISAFSLLAVSLILYPSWPWRWLKSLSGYQAYCALLTIPGPLLLLAFKRWRDPDARLLLLASIFPQRWLYDGLILWLIPKTRKEFLYTALVSWTALAWLLLRNTDSLIERGAVLTLSFHVPMLITILRRPRKYLPETAR